MQRLSGHCVFMGSGLAPHGAPRDVGPRGFGAGFPPGWWVGWMRAGLSGVVATSVEAMSVFSCSIVVAPMMLEVTKGREVTKASAICAGSSPSSRARST